MSDFCDHLIESDCTPQSNCCSGLLNMEITSIADSDSPLSQLIFMSTLRYESLKKNQDSPILSTVRYKLIAD
jgi:hypothetical protein